MTQNGVRHSHFIINEVNGYIDEHNANTYLTQLHADRDIDALKKYGLLWKKIKDLFGSTCNSSNNYNQKYMKIRFNSDDDLPLLPMMVFKIRFFRSVFHEGNKYYPQMFLDEYLYKLD